VKQVELERLAHKYRTLAALRRDRAGGLPIPERSIFKALAEEFPGALFELDHLTLEVIDARAEALRSALAGGEVEDWMRFVAAYHALYRQALRVKARVRARSIDEARASEIAREVGVDVALVVAVTAPPDGRIKPLVLARLAATFGVEAAAIAAAIFPRAPSSAKNEE
jgi:hypothetical protein